MRQSTTARHCPGSIAPWTAFRAWNRRPERGQAKQSRPFACGPPSAQVQQMGTAAPAIGASEAFQGNSKFSGRDENSNNITFGPALDQGRLQHPGLLGQMRSEEHTSELQSLMRISY